MAYNTTYIGTAMIDNDGEETRVNFKTASLGMATITFGSSYTLSLGADDLEKMRQMIHAVCVGNNSDATRYSNSGLQDGMNFEVGHRVAMKESVGGGEGKIVEVFDRHVLVERRFHEFSDRPNCDTDDIVIKRSSYSKRDVGIVSPYVCDWPSEHGQEKK